MPYVGSGVLGSAVAMDKVMAKTVLDAEGIAQARWRSVRRRDLDHLDRLTSEILDSLGRTVFVKPANMGSSIGVSRATGAAELADALLEAFRYDELAIVEEAIVARELECGVLGNDDPRASVVGEIVTGADFYDYDDKYTNGLAQTIVPADTDRRGVRPGPRRRVADLRGAAGRGNGPGRRVPRGRTGGARQRDQHDPGIHTHLDVPDAVGGIRPQLSRSRR